MKQILFVVLSAMLISSAAWSAPQKAKGKPRFLVGQGYIVPTPKIGHTASPDVIDWNEDGKYDLLVGSFIPGGPVFILLNTGTNEKPIFKTKIPVEAGGKPISVAAG